MTPFEKAYAWHVSHSHPALFPQIIEAHAQVGHVLITPEVFLLCRPIRKSWKEKSICNPWKTSKRPDTWHVWLFAGELYKVLPHIPYELPFITFHRHGEKEIRVMKFNPLINKILSLPRE